MARGLSEDAIKLPHLAYGGLGPTVRGNDRFDLFSKSRDALGHGSDIIQDMCTACPSLSLALCARCSRSLPRSMTPSHSSDSCLVFSALPTTILILPLLSLIHGHQCDHNDASLGSVGLSSPYGTAVAASGPGLKQADHEPDVHLASSPLSPMHSLSCLSHRRATATYTNAPIFIGIRPGSARHWQEAAVRRVRTWERRAQEEERQDIHLRVFVWGRSGRVEDTMRQIG